MAKNTKSKKTAGSKKGRAAVIVIIIVIILLAVLLAGCGMAATSYQSIFPNVYVGSVNVGGMTEAQARQAVEDMLAQQPKPEDMVIEVFGDRYVISGEEISGNSNAQLLVEEAYSTGRSESFFNKILYRFGLAGDTVISAGTVIGEDYLKELLSPVICEKIDASVEEDGQWLIVTKSRDGASADLAAAASEISAKYASGDYSAYILDAVSEPASLLDLQAVYDEYCIAPKNAFYDTETGEVIPHQEGFGFDMNEFKTQMENAAPGEKVYVMLKAVPAEITTDIAAAALFENVLYTCTTPLTDIPNRTNNVTLAANAMNGAVIMPGETFSFNKRVGERTAEKGYKKADVYVSGNTVGELGGGVCQVASTLYVCCLYTDLEIVERAEHQFFVTYVPAGLDATIYWGARDYQFKNNTDYPIMIEAFVEGLELTVTLKGEKSNDNYVEMISETLEVKPFEEVEEVDETKDPDYRELKHTGYTIKTYRNVYDKDGNLLNSSHEATSYYNRRDKTWIVGPQEEEPPVVDPSIPPEVGGDTPVEGGEVPPEGGDVPPQSGENGETVVPEGEISTGGNGETPGSGDVVPGQGEPQT